jgi:hypothetical protein
MELVLPDLSKSSCLSIRMCGEIVSSLNKDLMRWLKDAERFAAKFKQGEEVYFLGLILGGRSGKHVHIDIFHQAFAPETIKSKYVKLQQIFETLDRLSGLTIKRGVEGLFPVELKDLPKGGIIDSLFIETKAGNMSVKVKGADLAITGAPVNEISWFALEDEDTIGVRLEAVQNNATLSESYLTSALETLEQALNIFVLGRTSK